MDRQQRQLCRRTRLDMSKGERMKEWVSVLKATDAAARWHVHQRRKGSAQEPSVNHLLEVADMVAHALSGMMNVTMSAGVSEVSREIRPKTFWRAQTLRCTVRKTLVVIKSLQRSSPSRGVDSHRHAPSIYPHPAMELLKGVRH
jgi:hypothetical protein